MTKIVLEEFIRDWYWDSPSHEFARQAGSFLIDFIAYLATTALSEKTIRMHRRNTWLIGKFTADYGYHTVFSPSVFLSAKFYSPEFRRQVHDSESAVKSYIATCRRLKRYIESR